MQRSLPRTEEMFESKQMILEQRSGSAKQEGGGCPAAKKAALRRPGFSDLKEFSCSRC
jgi:hypothetical protein